MTYDFEYSSSIANSAINSVLSPNQVVCFCMSNQTFSPLYDVLNHKQTNQLFSETLWLPQSTDPCSKNNMLIHTCWNYPFQILKFSWPFSFFSTFLSQKFLEQSLFILCQNAEFVQYIAKLSHPASIGWVALSSLVCRSSVRTSRIGNISTYLHHLMF